MYVKIKKEVSKYYEETAKNNGLNSHDLINDAAAFCIAYLSHQKEAKKIFMLLDTIQKQIDKTSPTKKEIELIEESLNKTQKDLSLFFFPEIWKEIQELKNKLTNKGKGFITIETGFPSTPLFTIDTNELKTDLTKQTG